MVCIQEPHFNFQNLSRATHVWHSVYPTTHPGEGEWQRALTLIHKQLSTNSWTQIQVNSKDVVAVKIANEAQDITIYNIYNDCNHSVTIQTLADHLQDRQHQNNLLLGDFNRHHPMWDEERNGHLFTAANLNAAEELIELIADSHLEMVLPKDTPTLLNSAGNLTRPDNIFVTWNVAHWIIKCDTSPEDRPPKANHFLIHITINFPVIGAASRPMWNY